MVTSSGTCHVCGKVCGQFHYRTKFAGNGHDGYWHCEEHGPSSEKEIETKKENKAKDPTFGMNRAQRRKFARTGREDA